MLMPPVVGYGYFLESPIDLAKPESRAPGPGCSKPD